MDSRRVKTIGLASTILVLIVSSVSSAQAWCVSGGAPVYTRPGHKKVNGTWKLAGKTLGYAPHDTYVAFVDSENEPFNHRTIRWRYIRNWYSGDYYGWVTFDNIKQTCDSGFLSLPWQWRGTASIPE
jgi:hypothetical protein